jgi:cytochrome c oxidase subunit I
MSSTTQPSATWHRGRVAGWLVSVDHKRLGALYLGWASVFFVIAGILTLLMRLQMTKPSSSFLGSSTYAGMRTMHGTLLVFFVLVPVVVGLATFLVPLMIGARRIAMPGLAALSLWLFVFGGAAVVLSAFAGGGSSQAGWAGYPPITITQDGHGVDLWLIGMILLALSVTGSAANLAKTIQSSRAEGMTWSRVPLFVWSVAVWAYASVVLVPLAGVGLVLILLERRYEGSFDFFLNADNTVKGGLTWLYGQSFAYLALVPVVGIVAEILAVFGGRAIANAKVLTQALMGFAGLTLLLALYHAYAGAEGKDPSIVLLLLAIVAAIPAVVAVALLLETLWRARGSLRMAPPLLFAAGALLLLVVGVLSAVFAAIFTDSRDLRGTAFGAAHAHYLLWGAGLLALLGAVTYWWPKIFGRLLDDRLTAAAAVLLFVGVNCAFFPLFLLGDQGQPAGASSFEGHGSTEAYNVVSTIGAFATALGVLAFLLAVARAHNGRRAGNDPWQADTLEWYTTSPPPQHNFDSLPPITSARPLHDLRARLKERNAL